jgi:hypothetical protein
MAIPIDCPCGQRLRVVDELAGQLFRCPGCGRHHEVPAPSRVRQEPYAVPVPGSELPPRAEAATVPRLSAPAKFAIFLCAFVALALIAVVTLYFRLRDPRPEEERPRGESGYVSPALRDMNRNNLQQIAQAMHRYHDVYGVFPPAAASPRPGAPPVSWRVLILPYLGADDVFREWNMTEPWDGPNNCRLWSRMPTCYQLPPRPHDGTKTYYQVFVGPDTIFEPNRRVAMAQITDGTSNTILVAEGGTPVVWCEPVDIPFQPSPEGYDPKQVGGYFGKTVTVAMADGSARPISWNLSPQKFQYVITRSDGMFVNLDE